MGADGMHELEDRSSILPIPHLGPKNGMTKVGANGGELARGPGQLHRPRGEDTLGRRLVPVLIEVVNERHARSSLPTTIP
jgi:hypothetical protein